MKRKQDSVQERTQRQALSVEASEAHYFTSWTWTAIHFLSALPTCQTPQAMAERLHLPESLVLQHLSRLAENGLIERAGNNWRFKSGEFHAPADSPLVLLHHLNWRNRALLDAQAFDKGNIHFTGVLTLSLKDSAKIKALLLDFLSEAARISGPSKAEECVALTCDFFPV